MTKQHLDLRLRLFEHKIIIKLGAMLVAGWVVAIGVILALLPMVLK